MIDLPTVAAGQRGGRESNRRPIGRKSSALTTAPSQVYVTLVMGSNSRLAVIGITTQIAHKRTFGNLFDTKDPK